ncbi:MAG: hypothetical protein FWE80_07605 [Oscillospiraceae bacterium]|nr:hypothetical protein [Oscillospiraceae bacterium]
MKKLIPIAIMLSVFAAFILTGCSPSKDAESSAGILVNSESSPASEPVRLDVSAGKDADCFINLPAETFPIEIVQKGETKQFSFEGVSLDALLSSLQIDTFIKIELAVSDMEENLDITGYAQSEAGVFLGWSESGTDETPLRVFPKDAETGNLLTRNVTEIIITR